jgi:3-hydroxyacyl-[acyl-carrier-protein] dehydratase
VLATAARLTARAAETPLTILRTAESSGTVAIDWPAGLFLLRGHYPGFQIVPGVVLVEAADRAARAVLELGAARWSAIRSTRFTAPVFPGDRIEVEVVAPPRDGPRIVRCTLRLGSEQVCSVTLEYGGPLPDPLAGGLLDLDLVAREPSSSPDPDISQLLPHRYPMLLVDRLLTLEPAVRLVAQKAISGSEWCFADTPTTIGYPWPLVVESWCQSAGVLAAWDRPNPDVLAGQVMLFGGIAGVSFGEPARPGDVLTHHVNLIRDLGDVLMMAGHTTVGSRTVMTAERITMAMRPAGELTRRKPTDGAGAAPGQGDGHGA